MLGALGEEAAALRHVGARWPGAVLRTLAAVRAEGRLVAVPALSWPDAATTSVLGLDFVPSLGLAPAAFRPI